MREQLRAEGDETCSCCLSTDIDLLAYAVIAPWIAQLFGNTRTIDTRLRRCRNCGLRFFDYRYNESEMAAIYGEYRGERFFNLRRRWEPWMTRRVNDAFSGYLQDRSPIEDRNKFTLKSLTRAGINLSQLRGCIDFGGDMGQFIPRSVSPPLIVYEPNGVRTQLPKTIIGCDNLSDLPTKVDLGLNCYVLEHVSHPPDVLAELLECINPGGYVHVEVPLDHFRVSRFHRSGLYRRYLHLIIRFRLVWIAIDLLSGLWRNYRASIPWFGVVKQSEHINYFETRSLNLLLSSMGLTVQYVSDEDLKYCVGRVRQGRISATATL